MPLPLLDAASIEADAVAFATWAHREHDALAGILRRLEAGQEPTREDVARLVHAERSCLLHSSGHALLVASMLLRAAEADRARPRGWRAKLAAMLSR